MASVKIHTERKSAKNVLYEAVQAEKRRITYALPYNIPSQVFLHDWTADNLKGKVFQIPPCLFLSSPL